MITVSELELSKKYNLHDLALTELRITAIVTSELKLDSITTDEFFLVGLDVDLKPYVYLFSFQIDTYNELVRYVDLTKMNVLELSKFVINLIVEEYLRSQISSDGKENVENKTIKPL